MPVALGFAVGDFIAGINFLIDAVRSLNDTYGARADYQELGRELSNLTNALNGIQSLSLDPVQTNQIAAVNAAVNECRLCVDKFVRRNSKFKSMESITGKRWSPETFQQRARGVQWVVWKKDDVAKFRSEVRQQSDAIQMLLITGLK